MDKKLRLRDRLRVLRRGYQLARRMTPSFLPCTLAVSLIEALQPMAALFFSAQVLNELSGARELNRIILFIALAVGIAFVLSALKAVIKSELEVYAGFNCGVQLLVKEAEKFAQMDFLYTEDSNVSENLAQLDTKMRGNGLGIIALYLRTQGLLQSLFSLLFAFVLLAGMFTSNAVYTRSFITSSASTALLALLIVSVLALIALYRRGAEGMQAEIIQENAKANTASQYYGEYVQAEAGAKDIRLYDQRSAIFSIFAESFCVEGWHRFFRFLGRLEGFELACFALISGGVYLLIGLRALAGMYAVGNVVQYVGAVTALATALGSLVGGLGELSNNVPHIGQMLEYLDLPDVLQRGARTVPPPYGHEYAFEFRHVSFRYPGSENYALRDLNLTLQSGKRLAVVGLNGSGKTTMIKLLCRLYDPTEGEVLLDGVNIQEYDIREYHKLLSVVFQDFKLFPLELGHNVAAGDDAQPARAAQALELAGFAERLQKLPKGLETYLYKSLEEKEGVQVSGGEAQKIAIARALYKDAPIVILDEPTAALDPIAEFEVYSTFDDTIGKKTAIFISHRLSSCRFCHDIAVFEAGRVVQRGSHEALLADVGGKYHELWTAQAQHYVDAETGEA